MSRGNEVVPLQSRLPEDPSYWDDLADQIGANAATVLDQYQAQNGTWWGALARRAPVLAAAAILIITLTSFMLVRASAATYGSPHVQVSRAIGPTDPVARLFLSEETPPRVESLFAVVSHRGNGPKEETDR